MIFALWSGKTVGPMARVADKEENGGTCKVLALKRVDRAVSRMKGRLKRTGCASLHGGHNRWT